MRNFTLVVLGISLFTLLGSFTLFADEPPHFIAKWNVDISHYTCDIGFDTSGDVYLTGQNDCYVYKYDSSGNFINRYGGFGGEGGQFNLTKGLEGDNNGYIYVLENLGYRVQKFDSSFTFITMWGSEGSGDGQFDLPEGIAVDSSGNVYVVDTGNSRIQKFDSSGNFITKWGSYGTGDGEFEMAWKIGVSDAGYIFVADNGPDSIQKFDSVGNFITKWGTTGSGDGEFDWIIGVAIDDFENVYVSDNNNNRVQKFDSDGNFLTKWGTEGTSDGEFKGPAGIEIDSNGNIYVADEYDRIQIFSYSPTDTPTISPTLTPTLTPSTTPTLTLTLTATETFTPNPTITKTPTKTITQTPSETITSTPTDKLTPTPTLTQTNNPTETATPTISETLTLTPTVTSTPDDCELIITNPYDYYKPSFLLSWGPIYSVDDTHYLIELKIRDEIHTFDGFEKNWINVTASTDKEWQFFVSLGEMEYRVSAHDENHEIISGPTEWANFRCYGTGPMQPAKSHELTTEPGCLRISSPDVFDYNQILLTWTPIHGAEQYTFKYRYSTWIFEAEVENNWLRVISSNEKEWQNLVDLGKIFYSISALDSEGKMIDGPTSWTSFTCH